MKRQISFLIITILLLTFFSGCGENNPRMEELKVMNWADYIDESLNDKFELYYKQQTGKTIHVNYQTVESPQIMMTKIESGKEDWDLACPSESIAERMLKNGSLLPIDVNAAHMSNYQKYVSPYMKKAFSDMESSASPDPSKRYSVGYMWGTFGIMYNKDLVSQKINLEDLNSWDVMWNKDFSSSILMKNGIREILPIALIHIYKNELLAAKAQSYEAYREYLDNLLNLNINTNEKIQKVEETLKQQKKEAKILYETDDGKDGMVNGKYALDQAWNGDAVWAILNAADNNVNLDFLIPEEGSNIWYDAWVIPKYAKNKKAAEMYIDFLCDPSNATVNMDFIGYTSTVKSAEVIEWSFKNYLLDGVLADENNAELISLYENQDPSFYDKYHEWYLDWYENEYDNWYAENNGEGLDLTYFYNDEGVIGDQILEYEGRHYHTNKILANSIQYPPLSDINKCAVMKGFSDNIDELNDMWIRVKGQTAPAYVLVTLLFLLTGTAAAVIFYLSKKAEEKKKFAKLLINRRMHKNGNGNG
jgi:spermidine/putrescine transport system substrate-binding protein